MFVIFFKWWCQNSGPEFTFQCKKNIFNQDHRSSVVQTSNCKQQWRQRDSAHEPQEFLEFVNKVGGVERRKVGPIPHIGGVRSKDYLQYHTNLWVA